jgi:hypothetical protein
MPPAVRCTDGSDSPIGRSTLSPMLPRNGTTATYRLSDGGCFSFSLGPAALAFIGAGSKDDVLSARRMIEQFGDRWTVEWLRMRGLPDWAEYLEKLYPKPDPPAVALIGANGNSFHTNGKLNQREIRQ